ncbi:putative ribonuclease H protein, partial [Mucuna pruriens]
MASATCKLIWVKQLIQELKFTDVQPMKLYCDNQVALHIVSNLVFHERTKHIEIDCHFKGTTDTTGEVAGQRNKYRICQLKLRCLSYKREIRNCITYTTQFNIFYLFNCYYESDRIQEINSTLLVLILKCDVPTSLHQFSLISLCNVIYKIITKIIATRLKNVCACWWDPISVALFLEDISLIMWSLLRKFSIPCIRRGKMEVRFTDHFCKLINSCVSSTHMQVLFNGVPIGEFSPSRGVRQGDPISPYSFVLCMKRLVYLIERETNIAQIDITNNCLDVFCSSSRQKVSIIRTRLLISINVHNSKAIKLSRISIFRLTSDLGKYLGVPILDDRKKNETYVYLPKKTQRHLSNWKTNSLSFASRCTLAKVVVVTVPTYIMQIVLLPKQVYDKLESINRSFMWGESQNCRRCHTIAWNKFCLSKDVEGMDFRNFHPFNHDLIMKLGWGVITNSNALWYRCIDQFISSVHCIDHGSEVWKGISYTWKSLLLEGRLVISDGRQNSLSYEVKFCVRDYVSIKGQ